MSAKRPQSFASVRKRPQAFAKRSQSVRNRSRRVGHAGESTEFKIVAKYRTVVTFTFRLTKVSTVTGIGEVVVAKPRTVVTFGLVSSLRVSKVSTVTGIRGGRGRETQNCRLLDSPRVFASQKCQQSQGSGGVVVAKTRIVVTFGLVSGFRVSKVSTVTGSNSHRDRGGRGRETQNCRHFWTRLVPSRLKSVNSHRDPGGLGSRSPELSSLLDSPRVFASQKCQQSQGSGGVVVAKPRIVVTFGLVSSLRVSQVSTVTGIRGGRGRETQICRHFWTRLGSSRLESVNSHRDPGRNPELSSLLDSPRVFASRKCQQSQGSRGVAVAKPRIVVTFGLVSGRRVSKVSTVTGIGGGSWSRSPELSSLLDSPLERGMERGERRKDR